MVEVAVVQVLYFQHFLPQLAVAVAAMPTEEMVA
jgi:hypothetical protein